MKLAVKIPFNSRQHDGDFEKKLKKNSEDVANDMND